MKEEFLDKRLREREEQNALRRLQPQNSKIDFCSNDYLGIVRNKLLAETGNNFDHGSTGSRLLTGNRQVTEETEKILAAFHHAAAGLLFNSGYDANVGLLSCIPQKNDTIIYDQLSHASIRDGIRLSFAEKFSFAHNDVNDLEKKLQQARGNTFVVTESVFSMDGDLAPLQQVAAICSNYGAHLVVDEAHATGVIGKQGEGLVQMLGLEGQCFARIHTFGKAVGCHGAIVLGSDTLRNFLINFCRPFIYSTALPESVIVAIRKAYEVFPTLSQARATLQTLIARFQEADIKSYKLPVHTPIQAVIIPGNEVVKKYSEMLQSNGIDVRPILYPTVPEGKERLRIVLHSFNTEQELDRLLSLL